MHRIKGEFIMLALYQIRNLNLNSLFKPELPVIFSNFTHQRRHKMIEIIKLNK